MKSTFTNICVTGAYAIFTLLSGCDATAPVIPSALLKEISAPSRVNVELEFRYHSEWSPERREKAQAAARLFESALNSTAFSRQLEGRRDLLRTEGLSATELLRIIRSGSTLSVLRNGGGAIHKSITLPLSIAPGTREYANHDGFTDLDTGIIYASKDWLDHQSLCRLAGLFAHEYMHVIGFTHTTFNHPWRRLSVPYAIGDMVIAHSEASMGTQCSTPKK